jgi:hypothetical protein
MSLMMPTMSAADSWTTPKTATVTSPDGRWRARVVPNPKGGSQDGHAMAYVEGPAGKKAFALKNRWMPVDIVMFNGGTLLALDNWHRMGHGDVLTCYGADGVVQWSRTLEAVLGADVAGRVPGSVSSRWWRRRPVEYEILEPTTRVELRPLPFSKASLSTMPSAHRRRALIESRRLRPQAIFSESVAGRARRATRTSAPIKRIR